MTDTPQALADRLREEGERVIIFFSNLTQEQWGICLFPESSDWNLHHLLAHFVSSEIGHKELIQNIVSGGSGATLDFNIDEFNQREVDRLYTLSASSLLEMFSIERFELIKIISGLHEDDLERVGNDPYLGCVSLREIIKLTYRHLQIHLREVRHRL